MTYEEPEPGESIADENLARLLSSSYEPELPTPEFVASLTERMLEAAAEAGAVPAVRPLAETQEPSPTTSTFPWSALAAALLLGAGLFLWSGRAASRPGPGTVADLSVDRPLALAPPLPAAPPVRRTGETVSYQRPGSEDGEKGQGSKDQGLIARGRHPATAAPVPQLEVGATLVTLAGEKRRVGLADGSTLFVNERSHVEMLAPRELMLRTGEIYVEVAPRSSRDIAQYAAILDDRGELTGESLLFKKLAAELARDIPFAEGLDPTAPRQVTVAQALNPPAGPSIVPPTTVAPKVIDKTPEPKPAEPSPEDPKSRPAQDELKKLAAERLGQAPLPTFLVRTPDRTIAALGTKFSVRREASETQPADTQVTVAQGQVVVSGYQGLLAAGEQLRLLSLDDALPGERRTKLPRKEDNKEGTKGPLAEEPAADPAFTGKLVEGKEGKEIAQSLARATFAPRLAYELDWTRELVSAASEPLVPRSQHQGGALVVVDPNGQESRLSLRKLHVDVHLEDGFARTTIDSTYFNHEHSRQEGTFYFPLPPDASLSRLAMYVGGQLMEGGMVERDYGRNVFEEIVSRQKDPALLEWVDGSTFKMRVYPLEPREEKRILLSYTQRIASPYGRSQYRFPAGHNLPEVGEWSTELRCKRGAKFAWRSPSHELTALVDGSDLVLSTRAEHLRPDRDLVLEWDSPTKGKPNSASFARADHDGQSYLGFRYRPAFPSNPTAARERAAPRDWIFLFESSGDRDPLLAAAQTEIVRTLLENASHADTLAILTAGTRVTVFAPESAELPHGARHVATPGNIAQAIEFLAQTHLVGALDLGQALAQARALAAGARNPCLVHVGSGVPILGIRDAKLLASEVPAELTYVGIGVGKRWDRSFMRMAAARTDGLVTQINPDEAIGWRTFELLSTLQSPRLTNLRVAAQMPKGLAPLELLTAEDSLAEGDELFAVLRQAKGAPWASAVVVSGRRDGQPFEQTLPIAGAVQGADYLPRTWARLEIDRLVAQGAARHKEAIVELSKSMYVMSPFTSLLVLEDEAMYAKYQVDRGRKDHWAMYAAPAQIPVVRETVEEEMVRLKKVAEQLERHKESDIAKKELEKLEEAESETKKKDGEKSRTPEESKQPGKPAPTTPRPVVVGGPQPQPKAEPKTEPKTPARPTAPALDPAQRDDRDPAKNEDLGKESPVRESHVKKRFERDEKPADDKPDSGAANARRDEVLLTLLGLSPASNLVARPHTKRSGANVSGSAGEFDDMLRGVVHKLDPRPLEWEQSGGRGRYRDAGPDGVGLWSEGESLVIGQTQVVHEQIADRLDALKRADRRLPQLFGNDLGTEWEGRQARTRSPVARRNPGPLQGIYRDLIRSGTENGRTRVLIDDSRSMSVDRFSTFDARPKPGRGWRSIDIRSQLRPGKGGVPVDYSVNFFALDEGQQPGMGGGDMNGDRWGMPTDRQRLYRYTTANPELAARLNRPARLEFFETPLEDVVEYLKDEFDLPLQIDVGALEAKGLRRHVILGDRIQGDTLGGVFDRLLEPLDLTAVLQDDVLLVTTTEAAEAGYLAGGRLMDARQEGFAYRAPRLSASSNTFLNLTRYAPRLSNGPADAMAVLDAAEAQTRSARPGEIDPRVRPLVERARGAGWKSVRYPATSWRPADQALSATFNGQGACRVRRLTMDGLVEEIVCDGQQIFHLYPEIALGAHRKMTPWLEAELCDLFPWVTPSLDVLSRGCDVRLVDANIVALVPRDAESRRDPAGRPVPYEVEQLVFSAAGPLAERRWIEMPAGKLAARHVYRGDGSIEEFQQEQHGVSRRAFQLADAAAPSLSPELKSLVVFSFPLRQEGDRLPEVSLNHVEVADLARLAKLYVVGLDTAPLVIARDFLAQGDRRLGLFVLLDAPSNWQNQGQFEWLERNDRRELTFDPLGSHPDSALAAYLAQVHENLRNRRNEELCLRGYPPNAFLDELARFHNLSTRLERIRLGSPAMARPSLIADALDFVTTARSPGRAWMVFGQLQDFAEACRVFHEKNGANTEFTFAREPLHRELAKAAIRFQNLPEAAYAARYENARELRLAGDTAAAAQAFEALHRDTVAEGRLPPMDQAMRDALRFERDGKFVFHERMRETARSLAARQGPQVVVSVAWQAHLLGDAELATELAELAETLGRDAADRETLDLALLDFLGRTGRQEKAAGVVERLLAADPNRAWLWRVAAAIARERGRKGESIAAWERGLEIEFEQAAPDAAIDLRQLRADYAALFQGLEEAARTLAALDAGSSDTFTRRIVRAADRWRALDSDPTAACQAAARLLSIVGKREEAWEYLTTPLAERPNEAAPWLAMAQALKQEGNDSALTSRAYALAYEAEPTNAQILWDHAELLRERGRGGEAKPLLEKLSRENWQPRFEGLRNSAKQQLDREFGPKRNSQPIHAQ